MNDNYAGIDYGREISNVCPKTGIRYGVINQNKVGDSWWDSSEAHYNYSCPECERELSDEVLQAETHCPGCARKFEDDDFDMLEPSSFYVDDGEYFAECGEDGDIFITKSPYFTYAQFCSPCAPGAGYLMNSFVNKWENSGAGKSGVMNPEHYPEDYKLKARNSGYPKVYCLGHEWFEGGKAPYPVFTVEDEKIVISEN